MKEIPVFLVKANQSVLVVGTGLGIILQNVWIITSLFILSLLPIIFGPRLNLVFMFTRRLLQSKIDTQKTEAAELQRFNQTLATILLGLSTLILWLGPHWSGYVLAGMVTVAAGVALAGFA
ncbi:DUF4395 domain-containing protein [Bacillus horti]|uniref:Thiol:disulfide interchange protein n=1 Tax=Caldalkalibacillus horti TaxID=77523 RepID=A0ABT9W299_9BACI|nr:DUF4395 domain-containing protein [Bacillus horti]MDQ0167240.1 thiol:disulfide interchange protein [Bacillus horti]